MTRHPLPLCLLTFLLLCLPSTALATPELSSITVSYPLSGVEFQLYQAGEYAEDGTVMLTGDFQRYPVAPEDASAAETLAVYACRDNLEPLAAAPTSDYGMAAFTGLSSGVYLITGDRAQAEGNVYTPTAALIFLSQEAELVVTSTYEKEPLSSTTSLTVKSCWTGADSHPGKVRVQLLKNGEVEDTVTLNDDNEWQYQWSELDSSAAWMVAEKSVPRGYTVSLQRNGSTWTLTNTRTGEYSPLQRITDILSPTSHWWLFILLAAGFIAAFLRRMRNRRQNR